MHPSLTVGAGLSDYVQQPPASSPSFPIISNVVSLAPQGGQQKVNIKNNSGVPVVVSGSSPSTKAGAPVQQQIIIQPPPPKQVKNKSLLCKPFTKTKATSCRLHTHTKDSQTDPIKDKPVLIPVPVPTYVPVPMAMYTAPAPTPVFIPIPIPIPVFIPTTRKSANGILKQIKEIQEKTPADLLEAEVLMMAGDGKDSSDSETDEELLPEISQMVCRIEEEHLWECKQLGAHSPYVLLNTLIYFHTKYFMLKTPEDHMKLSFAHILKYWKKGQPDKGGQSFAHILKYWKKGLPGKGRQSRPCFSLRYYSVSTAKKDGSAPTSATKKGSKEGIPVYDVTENLNNPLRCPVKLYEFYLSKCPESIKKRSDIFYTVPERSCLPGSPVWYSTTPISLDVMTKLLTNILLVREIQEAHLHAQPIYV